MQVILHTGVHCTDEDKLLKGLLRNADSWRHEGVAIPGPSRYRNLLSEAVNALAGKQPDPDTREILLDAFLSADPDSVSRLILSHQNFFSVPQNQSLVGRISVASERLSNWNSGLAKMI